MPKTKGRRECAALWYSRACRYRKLRRDLSYLVAAILSKPQVSVRSARYADGAAVSRPQGIFGDTPRGRYCPNFIRECVGEPQVSIRTRSDGVRYRSVRQRIFRDYADARDLTDLTDAAFRKPQVAVGPFRYVIGFTARRRRWIFDHEAAGCNSANLAGIIFGKP